MKKSKTIMIISSDTKSLLVFRKEMMDSWVKQGYKVYALGNEFSDEWIDRFKDIGVDYSSFFVNRTSKNPIHDIKTFLSLGKLIKRLQPNIIFAYQLKSVIYTGLNLRNSSKIEFYPLMAGLGSMIRGKSGIVSKLIFFQIKLSLRKAKRIFFHNSDDLSMFTDRKIIQKDKGIVINGSGVNIDKFKSSVYPERITFTYVGRLLKDKGIVEFLNAAKKVKSEFPSVLFKVVGDTDFNPSSISKELLYSYVDSGIIKYEGYKSDIFNDLEKTSVLVLPSYHEGRSKVILEAMSMGRAIITTDAPGCRETIINEKHGYIVEVKSIEAIAKSMISFINNPSLITKFGSESRLYSEEFYDVKKVIEAINEVIF